MSSNSEQLEEYERQLADIEGLLEASPNDAALLSLKADLLELMAATLGTASTITTTTTTTGSTTESNHQGSELLDPDGVQFQPTLGGEEAKIAAEAAAAAEEENSAVSGWSTIAKQKSVESVVPPNKASATEQAETFDADMDPTVSGNSDDKPKKKKAKLDPNDAHNFAVPPELQITERDSKQERIRKKRQQQKLRREWQTTRQDRVATAKQASWQAFANKTKKAKKVGTSSIFQTDTSGKKVGVVGQRRLTKFEGPKKHK